MIVHNEKNIMYLTNKHEFEKNNVLFNYLAFGNKLIIGKLFSIACGTQLIMGSENHRTSSVLPILLEWSEKTPPQLLQLH